jgi:hypothetical protein
MPIEWQLRHLFVPRERRSNADKANAKAKAELRGHGEPVKKAIRANGSEWRDNGDNGDSGDGGHSEDRRGPGILGPRAHPTDQISDTRDRARGKAKRGGLASGLWPRVGKAPGEKRRIPGPEPRLQLLIAGAQRRARPLSLLMKDKPESRD